QESVGQRGDGDDQERGGGVHAKLVCGYGMIVPDCGGKLRRGYCRSGRPELALGDSRFGGPAWR
ncbi:MAG: hypothetical protein AB7E55_32255, partial [Pigmentiphaga sp.]